MAGRVAAHIFIAVAGVCAVTPPQIFLAFPPSILLYRFVFGYSYFGTLNMMATFIILGIGADGECPPALGLACQPEEGW